MAAHSEKRPLYRTGDRQQELNLRGSASVNMLECGKSVCETQIAHTKKCSMSSYHIMCTGSHRTTPPAPIIRQAQKSVNMNALDFYPNLGRISLDSGISDTCA